MRRAELGRLLYSKSRGIIEETLIAAWGIFKIMIPISIGVKVLDMAGGMPYIGELFRPIMKLMGLPGETGLIWATAIITNIYGGLTAFLAISGDLMLTKAQMTVLAVMILGAHNFPIELKVAQKSGVRLITMFLVRFGFAIISGVIVNLIYSSFNLFQEPISLMWSSGIKASEVTLLDWGLSELKNYLFILLIIFSIILVMKILRKLGVVDKLSAGLKPVFGAMGISPTVTPITIVGLLLGLLYGGALIISEVNKHDLDRMEVFYAMVFMGLCHSVIEDSLLLIAVGAHYSGVFVFRFLFAIIITFLLVKLIKRLPPDFSKKILIHR